MVALTLRLQAESTGLYLAHCFWLNKTGNSFQNSLKIRGSGGLWLVGKDGSGGEGTANAVEGCLIKGFTKSCTGCCSKLGRRFFAQILNSSQILSQGLCLEWMAAVLALFLSIYWRMDMHSDFMLLCSAGFGQTVGSAVGKNLSWMVGALYERKKTLNLALSVPF